MRRNMQFALCLLTLLSAPLAAQSYRSSVNDGNELYHQKNYEGASQKYEAATVTEPERPESYFNSGNASYRAFSDPGAATDPKLIERALKEYEQAGTRFRDREKIAGTLYNAGNVFLSAAEKGGDNPVLQKAAEGKGGDLRMEGYRQAIEMYKKALKLNPRDGDARYNLTYARKKLEELQQQDQNKQDKNQDQQQKQDQKKQDQNQDQQQKDKNREEEQNKQDKQDQQQQQQQNQKDNKEQEKAKQDQQKQPQPKDDQQMSKQQAEQILRALQREEKDLQKKKRQQQGRRVNVEKDW